VHELWIIAAVAARSGALAWRSGAIAARSGYLSATTINGTFIVGAVAALAALAAVAVGLMARREAARDRVADEVGRYAHLLERLASGEVLKPAGLAELGRAQARLRGALRRCGDARRFPRAAELAHLRILGVTINQEFWQRARKLAGQASMEVAGIGSPKRRRLPLRHRRSAQTVQPPAQR
jgi:hypothetical protein